MSEKLRWHTGDRIEVIDKDRSQFGKKGVLENISIRSGSSLPTGQLIEEVIITIKMEGTSKIVTFTNLTKNLDSQLKKLE